LREASGIFPRDEEFKENLLSKDIYNYRNSKYLLRKIENHKRKEVVNVNEYTIEHVMPQNENLSTEWKKELGGNWAEVQEEYLHTLGNITLTGYNSELSDSPYQVKKVYFDESPLRLNKTLQQAPAWNEAAILKRATELAILSAEHIWKFPHLDDVVLKTYKPVKKSGNGAFDVDFHYSKMSENTKAIYHEIRDRVLALDSDLSEKFNKYDIGIKYASLFQNFVVLSGNQKKIKVYLNVRYEDLNDTKRICRNVSANPSGHLNAEVELTSITQVDDLMELIQQQYNLLE
jgi:predicted transport protein